MEKVRKEKRRITYYMDNSKNARGKELKMKRKNEKKTRNKSKKVRGKKDLFFNSGIELNRKM